MKKILVILCLLVFTLSPAFAEESQKKGVVLIYPEFKIQETNRLFEQVAEKADIIFPQNDYYVYIDALAPKNLPAAFVNFRQSVREDNIIGDKFFIKKERLVEYGNEAKASIVIVIQPLSRKEATIKILDVSSGDYIFHKTITTPNNSNNLKEILDLLESTINDFNSK